MSKPSEVAESGAVAIAMADLALRSIGPDGAIVKVPAEDAHLIRTTFISRLAEAAMKILDEDEQAAK